MKKRIHINENDLRNIVREALENANYLNAPEYMRDDKTLNKKGIMSAIQDGLKLVCANCGNDNILIDGTVNPNTGLVVMVDNECRCNKCGQWAGLRVADNQ